MNTLRIIGIGLTCIFLLSLSSCKDEIQGIDMLYTDFFNIQGGANTFDTHYFQGRPRKANWSDFLGDLKPEEIKSIQPSFAKISNRDGIPMDFISTVVLEIYPNQNTNLTPWEVAYHPRVPNNTGTTLNFIPSLVDFKEELSDDVFIYRIGLRYREFPPTSFQAVLDFGFKAQVK